MGKNKKLRGAVVSALSLSLALSSMSGAVSARSINDVQGHWAEQKFKAGLRMVA